MTIQKMIQKSEQQIRVESLVEIGLDNFHFGYLEKAEHLLTEARQMYSELKNTYSVIRIDFHLAEIRRLKNDDFAGYVEVVSKCAVSGMHREITKKMVELRTTYREENLLQRYHLLSFPLSLALESNGFMDEAGRVINETMIYAINTKDNSLHNLCRQRLGELTMVCLEFGFNFRQEIKIGRA